MSKLLYLHVKNPKDDETPVEAAAQIFSSLFPSHMGLFKRIYLKPKIISFEMYYVEQSISFYVVVHEEDETFITSLFSSSYPRSLITKSEDPLEKIMSSKHIEVGEMKLAQAYYFPIKTYQDFANVDPLAPLIGFLSKQEPGISMGIQYVTAPATFPWAQSAISGTKPLPKVEGESSSHIDKLPASLVARKTAFQGGKVAIRLVAASDSAFPLSYIQNLGGTFGAFSLGEGNQLVFKRPILRKKKLISKMLHRKLKYRDKKHQILNAQELATLWHLPGKQTSGIKNLEWGRTLAGEPPANLPTATNMSEEEKKFVNFFATTEYKNAPTIFGIKDVDRRKHVYVMGKTGAGKSTLIANMAIDDVRKDRGVGIIDPHGDLSETIIDYIPRRRMNDVVYLEPFDTERPFALNVLEIRNEQHKDLIASGIVSIFSKIYANSWGPRLEYILRNVIISLLEIPDVTLIDALRILSEPDYRRRVVPLIKDQVIRNFWENEFEKMNDKLRTDAVSPIQNKVGQFVSSKMIRNIIGTPKSTINLEEIMNEGKILILNLSQGKLGEDNAALLGAMIITQIQLAAMNRAFMKEEDRRDFFLYVDEFQNFATSSFIKILSEARKYRLAITLANQYIDQLDETIQRAIFGNAGTLATFVTGANDATLLAKEFAEMYSQNELVSLGKYEIITKLSIDGMTSMPFPAKTLPLPNLKNDNRETIIRLSKERYGRKI